jgi:hypothetical protein
VFQTPAQQPNTQIPLLLPKRKARKTRITVMLPQFINHLPNPKQLRAIPL